MGVTEGVNDGVRVGISTRTGTPLTTACTVLTATAGWNSFNPRHTQVPANPTSIRPIKKIVPIQIGRNQSRRNGSPQAGQISKPRFADVPQYRQRILPDGR